MKRSSSEACYYNIRSKKFVYVGNSPKITVFKIESKKYSRTYLYKSRKKRKKALTDFVNECDERSVVQDSIKQYRSEED